MGFTLQTRSDQTALVRVENERDLNTSFVQVLESIIKQRVLSVEFDFSSFPRTFALTTPALLKLQDVFIRNKRHLMVRVGGSLTDVNERAKFESALTSIRLAGVEVIGELESNDASYSLNLNFVEMLGEADKGHWPQLETTFGDVQEKLERLLRRENELQTELSFYRSRIDSLRQNLPGRQEPQVVDLHPQLRAEIAEQARQHERIVQLQEEIRQAEEERSKAEKDFLDFETQLNMQYGAGIKALKLELADLEKNK